MLYMVPPSIFNTDTTSPTLKSVIVRAPSGGTPSTSVSILCYFNIRFKINGIIQKHINFFYLTTIVLTFLNIDYQFYINCLLVMNFIQYLFKNAIVFI